MPNPRINPVILLSPVEEGYIAYDPARDRLHQLNPLAALLAELCDGSRDIPEIRSLAAPLVPDGQTGEIDLWIANALKVGLLVEDEEARGTAQEFSAAELATLTKRLKEDGEIQAAYLCGKRIVELTPEDWDGWYDLGELALCLGRRADARIFYQKYFDARPEDGEIEHLLMALRDEAPPPRASDRAIKQIYKSFAVTYDTRMRNDLKYAGPERLDEAISAVIGDRTGLNVLDLGCGSGLEGMNVRRRACELTGIDLSPEMIELARGRGVYDRLEVAEINAWLADCQTMYDLIVSCDCLIYFGDLGPVTAAVARLLKPGAPFAFSMERGDRHPFHLTDTGRYTHHPDHVREVAAKCGLELAQLNESFLRWEYGEEVMGLYAVLRKPAEN